MIFRALLISLLIPALALAAGRNEKKGLSIEGGLLYDRPRDTAHDKPFPNMQSGFGYIASLGYDIVERAGLEIGVCHTGHDYDLFAFGRDIVERTADKTTFFVKGRAIPWRAGKAEIVTGLGAGLYDISGVRLNPADTTEIDEDFSGWGVIANVSLRYHVSGGLAASLYLGYNFVNYTRYQQFGINAPYRQGRLPGGHSFNWGLTLFHRIGVPEI